MIINHNLSAMFADRSLRVSNDATAKNMEKLSSGLAINRAGDDASGLAVSEKMRSQIRGLNQASKNAANGISFIQTTEGYLQESQDILQRLRELSVQAANGVYTSEDRMQIQVEVSQLVDEIDRIASHAQFNGMNLLTGRFARDNGENSVTGSMWFQIGANMDQRKRIYIGTMTAKALGVRNVGNDGIVTLEDADGANRTIGVRRRRPQDGQQAARRPRRLPEPSRARHQGHRRRRREHAGRREPHPRHRHGRPDGRIHQEPDTGPGRRRDARPGEPKDAIGLAAAPVA